MNRKTKRANNQVNSVMKVQEQREMVEKANRILSEMKSFTWRDLETQGKFNKNDKLSFGKLNEAPFIRLFMPVSKTLIIR